MTGDQPIPRAWTGWRVEDVDLPTGVRVRVRLCPFDYYPMPRPLGWVEHDQRHAERERRWQPHRYVLSGTPWDEDRVGHGRPGYGPPIAYCGMCRNHVLMDKPNGVLSYLHPTDGRQCGCCPAAVAPTPLHSSRKEVQA